MSCLKTVLKINLKNACTGKIRILVLYHRRRITDIHEKYDEQSVLIHTLPKAISLYYYGSSKS